MNRRIALISVLVLLLVMLLIWFWSPEPGDGPGDPQGETTEGAPPLAIDLINEGPEQDLTSPTQQPKAIVEKISHSSIVNDQGYFEIFGELENVGVLTASNIVVNATIKNERWEVVGKISGRPGSTTLRPGQKTGFKMMLADKSKAPRAKAYVLTVTFDR